MTKEGRMQHISAVCNSSWSAINIFLLKKGLPGDNVDNRSFRIYRHYEYNCFLSRTYWRKEHDTSSALISGIWLFSQLSSWRVISYATTKLFSSLKFNHWFWRYTLFKYDVAWRDVAH